jgi:hypothetical protein
VVDELGGMDEGSSTSVCEGEEESCGAELGFLATAGGVGEGVCACVGGGVKWREMVSSCGTVTPVLLSSSLTSAVWSESGSE